MAGQSHRRIVRAYLIFYSMNSQPGFQFECIRRHVRNSFWNASRKTTSFSFEISRGGISSIFPTIASKVFLNILMDIPPAMVPRTMVRQNLSEFHAFSAYLITESDIFENAIFGKYNLVFWVWMNCNLLLSLLQVYKIYMVYLSELFYGYLTNVEH